MSLLMTESKKSVSNPEIIAETEYKLNRLAAEMQRRFSAQEVIEQIRGASFGEGSKGVYTAQFVVDRNAKYEAIVTSQTLSIWRGKRPSVDCPDEDGIKIAEYCGAEVSRFYQALGRRRPEPFFMGPVGK